MAERPKVILAFDDGKVSVFNKAFPIMRANNQVGVAFIITGEVTNNPVPNVGSYYMNLSELSALYNSSWDLSSHTVTHPHLTQITSTELNYELSASKAFLDSAGFTRGSMFFAYPYGDYNTNVISALKSNSYVAARTVDQNVLYTRYILTNPDVFEMKTLLVDGLQDSNTPKTTVLYIKSEIDNTITNNGLLIISFHNIVDTIPSYNEEYLTSDFKQISDYLKNRSDAIDVVSMSNYFFSMTPTPTPTAGTLNVSGFKINDTNGNGVWDVGEIGIGNWNINLLNATTYAQIASTLTNASGLYQFTNLISGVYNVTEEIRAGFIPTNDTFRVITIENTDVMNVNFLNQVTITPTPTVTPTPITPSIKVK